MNNKGYVDSGDMLFGVFFSLLLGVALFSMFYFITIELPIARARRDMLLKNPEKIIVSEWQRGGELPKIPEITVNWGGRND